MLNPLAELAAMWHVDQKTNRKEVLSLDLHWLQDLVPDELLLRALQRALISSTCNFGVDLNLIAQHPTLRAPLQFVCGLGSRLASDLLEHIRVNGRVPTRASLFRPYGYSQADQKEAAEAVAKRTIYKAKRAKPATAVNLPKVGLFEHCVYTNCAAFLIIRPDATDDKRKPSLQNAFDTTRIHPERYSLAMQVCCSHGTVDVFSAQVIVDGLGLDELVEPDDWKKILELFNQIRQHHNITMLDDLDLDAFAELEAKDGHLCHESMYLIKEEITYACCCIQTLGS